MELDAGSFSSAAFIARKILCEQVSGPPLSEAKQRGKPDGWLGLTKRAYATGGSRWAIVQADAQDATIQPHADCLRKLRLCAGRSKMQITPQITFEGSESSDAARDAITREIARLETHNKRITGCRVTVIAPSHKHRHGTGFEVHIWLTIPSYENIVVNNSASDDARHEHAEVAIKDAFAAARRQVDDLAA